MPNDKYNSLYSYLKQEKLTDLDSETFYKTYSTDTLKYNELYAYLKKEGMTDLDPITFKSEYFETDSQKKNPLVKGGQPLESIGSSAALRSGLQSNITNRQPLVVEPQTTQQQIDGIPQYDFTGKPGVVTPQVSAKYDVGVSEYKPEQRFAEQANKLVEENKIAVDNIVSNLKLETDNPVLDYVNTTYDTLPDYLMQQGVYESVANEKTQELKEATRAKIPEFIIPQYINKVKAYYPNLSDKEIFDGLSRTVINNQIEKLPENYKEIAQLNVELQDLYAKAKDEKFVGLGEMLSFGGQMGTPMRRKINEIEKKIDELQKKEELTKVYDPMTGEVIEDKEVVKNFEILSNDFRKDYEEKIKHPNQMMQAYLEELAINDGLKSEFEKQKSIMEENLKGMDAIAYKQYSDGTIKPFVEKMEDEMWKSEAKLSALTRMALLNGIDLSKGLGYYTDVAKRSFLQSLGIPQWVAPDLDPVMLEEAEKVYNEHGLTPPKEVAEKFEKNLTEHIISTGAGIVPVIGQMWIGNKMLGAVGVLNMIKNVSKTKPLLGFMMNVVREEMLFQGILGGQVGVGSGFYAGSHGFNALFNKLTPGNPFLKGLATVVGSGLGGTFGAATGEMGKGVYNELTGKDTFKQVIDEYYGNYSEFSKRIISELVVFSLIGLGGGKKVYDHETNVNRARKLSEFNKPENLERVAQEAQDKGDFAMAQELRNIIKNQQEQAYNEKLELEKAKLQKENFAKVEKGEEPLTREQIEQQAKENVKPPEPKKGVVEEVVKAEGKTETSVEVMPEKEVKQEGEIFGEQKEKTLEQKLQDRLEGVKTDEPITETPIETPVADKPPVEQEPLQKLPIGGSKKIEQAEGQQPANEVLKDVESTAKALGEADKEITFVHTEDVSYGVGGTIDIREKIENKNKKESINSPKKIEWLPSVLELFHVTKFADKIINENSFKNRERNLDTPIDGIYFTNDKRWSETKYGEDSKFGTGKEKLSVSINNDGLVYFDTLSDFVKYLKDNKLPFDGRSIESGQLDVLRKNGVKGILLKTDFASQTGNELIVIDESIIKDIKKGKKTDVYTEIPKSAFNMSPKEISEAYHKAKSDGSNPELVRAVEELLGKPVEGQPVGQVEGQKPAEQVPVEVKQETKAETKQEITDEKVNEVVPEKQEVKTEKPEVIEKEETETETITEQINPVDVEGIAKEVENVFEKQKKEIASKKVGLWERIKRGTVKRLFDVRGVAKKSLIKSGFAEAVRRKELEAGASAAAKSQIQEYNDKIFKGLSKQQVDLLNKIIEVRRDISIDTRFDAQGKPRPKHKGGLTKEKYEIYLSQLEQKNPKLFEKINKRADAFFDAYKDLLKKKLDEGRISQEVYDALINNEYSPRKTLEHLMEQETMGRGGVESSSGRFDIKNIEEGSEGAYFNDAKWLLETSTLQTYRTNMRNKTNRALYEFAEKQPDNGIVEIQTPIGINKETGQPSFPEPRTGWTQIQYFDNGVKKSMIMQNEIAKDWESENPVRKYMVPNIIRVLSGGSVLRAMATGINPVFALSNLPKDFIHILVATDAYSTFLPKAMAQLGKDYAVVLKDVFTRKGRYKEYIEEGGGMDYLTHQGKVLESGVVGKSKTQEAIDATEHIIGYINETSELIGRVAIREREIKNNIAKFVKENGRDPNEKEMKAIKEMATYEARAQMDFSKGGDLTKFVDQLIPYTNAAFVGFNSVVRGAKKNPKAFAAKVAQIGSVAVALFLYNDEYEEYKDIPKEIKARNFIIMLPFTKQNKKGQEVRQYISIPKTLELSIITQLFENVASLGKKGEVEEGVTIEALKTSIPTINPLDVPALNAAWTYIANYDRFRDQKIWKGGEVLPEDEYTKNTSDLFKGIGKALNMSPVRLEAATGKIVTDTKYNIYSLMIGKAYNAIRESIDDERERKELDKTFFDHIGDVFDPFKKKFLRETNPDYTKYKEEEKQRIEQLKQKKTSSGRPEKTGRTDKGGSTSRPEKTGRQQK